MPTETTEHTLVGRARSAVSEFATVVATTVLVAATVYIGAIDVPLWWRVPTFALVTGVPSGFGIRGAATRAAVRRNVVMSGLQTAIFAGAVAWSLAPTGALAAIATLGLAVTVAVAGTALYVLAFEADERVPYLSHYVETGAWT